MEPERNPSSARDLASKIAAGYGRVPMEDGLKKPQQQEEAVQNPDLDRAFDELVESYGTKHREKVALPVPGLASVSTFDAEETESASDRYECPECGHMNPGSNQFCGKCGAEHGETVTAPARRVTDEGSVALNVTSNSGIKHFHHHYHHYHYRSSPYLFLSIMVLLAVIAWQAGWEYGLRVGAPPLPTKAAEPKVHPGPSGAKTDSKEPALPRVR